MNTAQQIAISFHDDGSCLSIPIQEFLKLSGAINDDRISIGTACVFKGAQVELSPCFQACRYVFDDKSVIVESGDGWDFEGKEPFSFVGVIG